MNGVINDEAVDYDNIILHNDEGIDLIPGNIELADFEMRLVNVMSRERVLTNCLFPLKNKYDYIVVDCPPSIGMLTVNVLSAADEVRLLDNEYALLFIRGESPIFDKKYDLLKHPRIKDTTDGGAPKYVHGEQKYMITNWKDILNSDKEYEILTNEDMDNYFRKLEEKENEKKNN